MKPKLALLLIFVATTLVAHAEQVRVNIFSQSKIKTLVFSTEEGKYSLSADTHVLQRLKKNSIIYFTVVGKKISVWDQDEHLGIFEELYLSASGRKSIFKAEPAVPAQKARTYDGSLKVTVENGCLKLINYVSVNDYLAGVVESESGIKAPYEYYKTQAIISRTYLYEMIGREGKDKYLLVDNVNHQVYLNRSYRNSLIRQAVNQTTDLIIVDSTRRPINAVFHSNSGGQTANSEDVWLSALPYLRSVADSFSLKQRQSVWHDTVSVNRWVNYLIANGINATNARTFPSRLNYDATQRSKYYYYGTDSIMTRKIREDFKFRSAWFSIKAEGNVLKFTGYGYGHGVGLSQEGAMEMARRKLSYLDIIHFYYKDVEIVNLRELKN